LSENGTIHSTGPENPGFGVYVHWPFCLSKCPYCDFNSHVRHEKPDEPRFTAAISSELAHAASMTGPRVVNSIFFGGGTPSLMSPETVATILQTIASHWRFASDVEITLEANPTSVEAGRFRGYRAAGVNRVSLGVQSLNNDSLKFLGRLHTAEEALKAVDVARKNFERISFDMIYAQPGQTPAAWREELARALREGSEHLSIYQLTIEPETPFEALFKKGSLKIPDHELGRALWDVTQELCNAAGLEAYEISNHARVGTECRHNLVYWRYGEYVGVGPGAHGRLGTGDQRRATVTEKHPERWLAQVEKGGHGLVVDEPLSRTEQADEYLLMGLRLREGIDLMRYQALSGQPLDPAQILVLQEHGLIESDTKLLRVTSQGFPLLDSIVADLAA
jgi:putative oxygen-independent coproporphyrinogen III oxidase